MPFVTPGHRAKPDLDIPGDRCYVYYKWMVDNWKREPRWTTADAIYQEVLRQNFEFADFKARSAMELAWQVFFQKYVMPYEDLKEKENGTI